MGEPTIFAESIAEIRTARPGCEVEVLIPDFKGDPDALDIVMKARPEVLNHNTETVVRLQRDIRTAANYGRSLALLWRAAQLTSGGAIKSGLIVGMGETRDEVLGALADLRAVGVDIVTIGQYLRPTARHRPVAPLRAPRRVRRVRRRTAMPSGCPMSSRAPWSGRRTTPRRRGPPPAEALRGALASIGMNSDAAFPDADYADRIDPTPRRDGRRTASMP